MQRRAYDRNQINRILYRLDYHGKHRSLGYGIIRSVFRNKGDEMREWVYEAKRAEHLFNEVRTCEVECYEDGTQVTDGNPEGRETFLDVWYQCSCGQKYKTEEDAVDCCFPRYHVDYEE